MTVVIGSKPTSFSILHFSFMGTSHIHLIIYISALSNFNPTSASTISANIECLTAAKASILSEMCKRECCHCLCLQETHRSTNLPRPKIAGMSLVVERPHNKYGSAILIRNDLKVKKIYERIQGTVELITIVMPGVVHSVQATQRPV